MPTPFFLVANGRAHTGGTGTAGFVAINNVDDPWSTSFSTGLPTGSYCNVIDGSASDGFCSGTV
jgi:hypothetical protein